MKQALGKCSRMVSHWSGSLLCLEVLCNLWIHWEIIKYQNGKQIRDVRPAFLHHVWRVALASKGMKNDASPCCCNGEAQEALYYPLWLECLGEIQIPWLVPSEPTAAQADNTHLQLQHTELRGELALHHERDRNVTHDFGQGLYFLLITNIPYLFFFSLRHMLSFQK